MSWWIEDRAAQAPVPEPDRDRELVLYRRDACGACARVERALQELGLDVPRRDTWRDRGAGDELLAKTGRTQVPCLFVDGAALFESRDIAAWLTRYAARGARVGD